MTDEQIPKTMSDADLELGMQMLEDDKKERAQRRATAIANREAVETEFTEMVIEALESGSPLGKWDSGHTASNFFGGFPKNFHTGKMYRGSNVFWLFLRAQKEGWSAKWGTRTQWLNHLTKLYNRVTKTWPEHMKPDITQFLPAPYDEAEDNSQALPSPVVFFKPVKGKKKDKKSGKLTDKDAWIPMMRFYQVYNQDQLRLDTVLKAMMNLNPPSALPLDEREKLCWDIVNSYVERTGITIEYRGAQSFNQDNGGKDKKGLVVVPERDYFKTPALFWAHLFHELVHSTGHSLRLNRPKSSTFADWTDEDYENDEMWDKLSREETYAREELVAELGAGMLCLMMGFEYDTRHAQYLKSWIGALENDHSLILKMATASQKALDLILGTEFKNKDDTPADKGDEEE